MGLTERRAGYKVWVPQNTGKLFWPEEEQLVSQQDAAPVCSTYIPFSPSAVGSVVKPYTAQLPF
jgi:hypothetical protein